MRFFEKLVVAYFFGATLIFFSFKEGGVDWSSLSPPPISAPVF